MESEKKKANVNIDSGKESFYANNLAVFNNANEFVLDFTQVSPRMDVIDNKRIITYIVKHNPIVVEPRQAKAFLNLLKENIEKFESKFGKIDAGKIDPKDKKAAPSKKFAEYIG
jgi:hypothetical protein